MQRVRQLLRAATIVMAGLLSIWFAAVRAVPGVRRRKAALRRERMG